MPKIAKAGRTDNRGGGTLTMVLAGIVRSGTARATPASDPIYLELAEEGVILGEAGDEMRSHEGGGDSPPFVKLIKAVGCPPRKT